MSQFKKTTNVKIAAGNSVPINLSRNHFTTLGFGCVTPVYNLECVPGDKITIRPELFARVAPMALPPFANVDVKMTAFFVPFRNVWTHWNNFLGGLPVPVKDPEDSSVVMRVLPSVPTINQTDLIQLFTNQEGSFGVLANIVPWSNSTTTRDEITSTMLQNWLNGESDLPFAPSDSFDFAVSPSPSVYVTYKLTVRGKRALQILHSLGYNFNFFTSQSTGSLPKDDPYFSALPLLCFFKAYLDWHVPSQIQNSQYLHGILKSISDYAPFGSSVDNPAEFLGDMKLDFDTLYRLFSSLLDYYDNDYFTSAWLTANAPAEGLNEYQYTAQSDGDITTNNVSQVIKSDSLRDSNPQVATDAWDTRARTPESLSYDGLTLLQRFANFVRRNNFAGSRAVERILARFGVRVPDAVVDYSDYIGQWQTPLRITDVTSQGSEIETLGDYAGKGYVSTNGESPTWSYEVKQHGMLFVFAAINPNTTFVDGVRRELFHLSPLDYYTPEFDGTLMQAISGLELAGKIPYGSPSWYKLLDRTGVTNSKIFGFIQRYAEYKRSIDDVSGDFDVQSLNASLDGFLMTRRLFNIKGAYLERTDNPDNIYRGIADNSGTIESNITEYTPIDSQRQADAVQYNKIFKDTTGRADPFFCQFHFSVTAHRRMLAANDTAELFGRGQSNEMNTNGARV